MRAEITRYHQVSDELINRVYKEGREPTEADFQAVYDDFFTRLEPGLSSEKIQQVQDNFDRYHAPHSPEEEACWEIERQQALFEEWFTGIELTPKQEQFVRAEITRYGQVSDSLDRAYEEGRELPENAYQSFEDEFFARLEQGLSSGQLQQVRFNYLWRPLCNVRLKMQYFELLFTGTELTSREAQFAQIELFRYEQVFHELIALTYKEEGRGLTDTEIQALDDELYIRLGRGLSLRKIQQLRENHERIQMWLESPYPGFSPFI